MQRNRGQRSSGAPGEVNTSNRYLYHYTNREGFEGIGHTGRINPSTNTTRDAILGKAVYMTDVAPCNRKDAILQNNYGADPGFRQQDKADYYVKIPRDSIRTKKSDDPSRGVYRSWQEGKPLDLKGIQGVRVGQHGKFEAPIEDSWRH